jgi:hypothetical protein
LKKHLHIISFDIPYPANYGGAIDVYFKLKALHQNGVEIILHCFEYNRKHAPELEEICKKVYYYKRNISLLSHISVLPYTVYSRKNPNLLKNLLKDDYPILFEGLMSCYYLNNPTIANRTKLFRETNIEHDYYYGLAKATNNLTKKLYYSLESLKFKVFEKKIESADVILAISQTDENQLKLRFSHKQIKFIPCYNSNDSVTSLSGQSDFLLYHANLSVPENEIAAIYICENIFSKLKYRCVIAGLNPTKRLTKVISNYHNIQLVANPNEPEMTALIQNAQVHVLITFQGTGLKLKLLNTLFAGRHLLVNQLMLSGTNLDELCNISDLSTGQLQLCEKLMQTPFNQTDISKREKVLFPQFSNKAQAEVLMEMF